MPEGDDMVGVSVGVALLGLLVSGMTKFNQLQKSGLKMLASVKKSLWKSSGYHTWVTFSLITLNDCPDTFSTFNFTPYLLHHHLQ